MPGANRGPDYLTSQAAKFRQLAQNTPDQTASQEVLALADELQAEAKLLRNDQKLQHHWMRFKLIGTKSNRDAIGAWIQVRLNGRTLLRQVMPTKSYLSQCELPVTIGLGDATKVEGVEIRWPGGKRQMVENIRLDTTSTITESP